MFRFWSRPEVSWSDLSNRHGDWGREAAWWLGHRLGRLRLSQLGELEGGTDYAAVGQALGRFGKRLEKEPKLQHKLRQMRSHLSHIEM